MYRSKKEYHVYELSGNMHLTPMTLDNWKPQFLEQRGCPVSPRIAHISLVFGFAVYPLLT